MTTPPPAPSPTPSPPAEPPPGGLDAERPDGPPQSPDTPKDSRQQQCAVAANDPKCLL